MSSRPELRLDWCSHAAAKYAVEKWHYSGRLPTGKNNYLGVWEDSRFVGVVIFGLGATGTMGKPYGLSTFELAELVRDSKNPGLRALISFADPYQGHAGIIYQAGGWIYTGTSGVGLMYRLKDGSMAHPRRFTGRGWNAPQPIPAGAEKVITPGKHRYLYPLDREMRERILPLAKPYPKRAGSIDSDASAFQAGEGGVTPTPALQETNHVT